MSQNQYKSPFLSQAAWRGFINQGTDIAGLDALMNKQPIAAYIGFDCTADSLHVGSLMQIMILRLLQKCGHRPIILLGGGTTRIGDPSGKDEARKLLSDADIEKNKRGIEKVFHQYLDFSGENKPLFIDNDEWLREINYISFLRDIGRHFSINRMLTFDSVKLRLEREQSLSFLEFNYMLLQAYDFVELYKKTGCILQIGGSDQWGNIVCGVELGRRLNAAGEQKVAELYGLTSPLITTSSGAKMGKTASGAIWLDAEKLSPFDYWQFWRNCEDADVGRFLRFFTELEQTEIIALENLKDAQINDAKIRLANEATRMLHGEAAALAAYEQAKAIFAGGNKENYPVFNVGDNNHIVHILVASGMCVSNGEAKRLIKGGGVKINGEKVEDENLQVDMNMAEIILSAGKKKHLMLLP